MNRRSFLWSALTAVPALRASAAILGAQLATQAVAYDPDRFCGLGTITDEWSKLASVNGPDRVFALDLAGEQGNDLPLNFRFMREGGSVILNLPMTSRTVLSWFARPLCEIIVPAGNRVHLWGKVEQAGRQTDCWWSLKTEKWLKFAELPPPRLENHLQSAPQRPSSEPTQIC